MRITQEADYALRMVSLMAEKGLVGAPEMAECVKVPQRFAVKILRKLSAENIVCSVRGINGGYKLVSSPDTLTVSDVIEAVEGNIEISKCLSPCHTCANNCDKSKCRYHNVFACVNDMIKDRLSRLTVAMMIDTNIPVEDLINTIK